MRSAILASIPARNPDSLCALRRAMRRSSRWSTTIRASDDNVSCCIALTERGYASITQQPQVIAVRGVQPCSSSNPQVLRSRRDIRGIVTNRLHNMANENYTRTPHVHCFDRAAAATRWSTMGDFLTWIKHPEEHPEIQRSEFGEASSYRDQARQATNSA